MVTAYPQAIEKTIDKFTEVSVSPYVKNFDVNRRQLLLRLLPKDAKLLKFHQSLCPGCVDEEKFDNMKIDAVTYARNGKVWVAKECLQHGTFRELSWSDYEMYRKAEKFQDPGIKILNPNIDKSQFEIDCPSDCGLCVEHESHTGLGNIVVTNRCDLTCWYCFFYAKEGEPIYEPTMDQIRFMLKRMRDEKPVGANSVQFTGGEPTIREDLPDIIRAAKEIGYGHVQLNTNGINLARDPNLAMKLHEAGVSNLYMSFDGLSPQTNPKNYWEAQTALENCYKANIGVVLVPTVIGGVNDHELGDIIRFGMGNNHVVRSANFQPVSLVGRMPDILRKRQRITIPGAIKRIEEQTDGQIGREDFFPVPCAKQITDFIEAIKEEPQYRLSIHFQCGMATYAFKNGQNMVPITRFFDIEGFFEYLGELTKELRTSNHKRIKTAIVMAKLALNLKKFIDEERKPKSLNFVKVMRGAVQGGNYHGLADFHNNSLFIGMMHFQDPYNWDIDRIHKCDIHYATPDGRILPFCTFNVIPELYRDRIQRKFSIPASEWEKRSGKKLSDDKHHRKLTPDEMRAIKANYDKYRRTLTKPELEPDWGYEEMQEDEIVKKELEAGKNNHSSHDTGFLPLETMLTGGMIAGASKGGFAHAPVLKTIESEKAGGCGSGCGCGG